MLLMDRFIRDFLIDQCLLNNQPFTAEFNQDQGLFRGRNSVYVIVTVSMTVTSFVSGTIRCRVCFKPA